MKKAFLVVLMLSSSLIFAQNSISGSVSDESNNPIPGATVVVQGTTTGVVTDFDGNYQINASAGDQLTFSSLGFGSQTITVGNQNQINVTLMSSVDILDEVVVSGYQTQQRRSLSGAIGTVDTDEAFKTQVTNAAEALQGRVAGVQVTSGGGPGAAPVIRVRGYSTTNDNSPLYVIDGIQTTDPNVMRDINPRDIENISVLKDGSAAIYGARASNGVIVVTTKKGSYNQANTLTVDASYGIANVTRVPDMLNLQQHADMTWQSILNDGNTPSHPQYGTGATPSIPIFLNVPMPSGAEYDGAGAKVKVPNGTSWFDELFDQAAVSDISISASGGSEQGRYHMSANYLKQEGVMIHTGYERASTRLNSEFKIGDKLTVSENLNITYDKEIGRGANQIQNAAFSSPLIPVRDTNGNFAGTYSNSARVGIANNPIASMYRARNNYNKNLRVIGDIQVKWNITPQLDFVSKAGIQMRDLNGRSFTPLNPEHGEAISNNTLSEDSFRQDEWVVTNFLNYKNSFGDHTLDLLVGTEQTKRNYKGFGALRTNYLFEDPSFYLLSNGSGVPVIGNAGASSSSISSLLATANWTYNNIGATATVRKDDTSRFAQATADAIFPSASMFWLLSNEDWFDSSVFDTLKLRASYGELGNQEIGISNADINISNINEFTGAYAYGGSGGASAGAVIASKGNPLPVSYTHLTLPTILLV